MLAGRVVRGGEVVEEGVPGALVRGGCIRGRTQRTAGGGGGLVGAEVAQDVGFPVFGVQEGLVAVEDGEEAGVGRGVGFIWASMLVVVVVVVVVIVIIGIRAFVVLVLVVMVVPQDVMRDQKLGCQPRVHRGRRARRRIRIAGQRGQRLEGRHAGWAGASLADRLRG